MDKKTRQKAIASLRTAADKLDPPGKVSAAKLTRKHFEEMAKAIASLSNPDDRKMMLDALAPMLMASNPRFDMERFSKAAKVEGSAVDAARARRGLDWAERGLRGGEERQGVADLASKVADLALLVTDAADATETLERALEGEQGALRNDLKMAVGDLEDVRDNLKRLHQKAKSISGSVRIEAAGFDRLGESLFSFSVFADPAGRENYGGQQRFAVVGSSGRDVFQRVEGLHEQDIGPTLQKMTDPRDIKWVLSRYHRDLAASIDPALMDDLGDDIEGSAKVEARSIGVPHLTGKQPKVRYTARVGTKLPELLLYFDKSKNLIGHGYMMDRINYGDDPEGGLPRNQDGAKIVIVPDSVNASIDPALADDLGDDVSAGRFMQPEVFKDNAYVVETREGTSFIPEKVVGVRGGKATIEDLADYVDGTIEDPDDIEYERNQWFAQGSAPGYMDQTGYAAFDKEEEAWEYLIEYFPNLFTWTVEFTGDPEAGESNTAHIRMESRAAAKAMKDAVQSLAGSRLEADGEFIYVMVDDPDDAKRELEGAGFDVEEG